MFDNAADLLPRPLRYEWLGEDGCKFTDVIHANANSTFVNSAVHGTIRDAEKLLAGNCSLSTVSTLTP